MSILVLGGTAFLGGEVALAGLAAGHEVTCLARGDSGTAPPGVGFVRGDRTRKDGYAGLSASGTWDLVVDVSRQPGQVRSALDALAARADRWTFVSTGSVYADHSRLGAGTDAPLLTPLEGDEASPEQYGEGKVACEQACESARGADLLVARCGLIAGRGDPSDRFGYWPGRFALAQQDGGPVLVPGGLDRPAQAVDVVDLARWLVDAGLAGTTGVVDAYGPRRVLGDVLDVAREVAGFTGRTVTLSDDELVTAGVEEYMGPRSLPLWLHDPDWAGFSARSTGTAVAAGLTARPLADTTADALAWERDLGLSRVGRKAGLDRADELQIVSTAR